MAASASSPPPCFPHGVPYPRRYCCCSPQDDYRFGLLWEWNLYESMMFSPYVASRLQTYTGAAGVWLGSSAGSQEGVLVWLTALCWCSPAADRPPLPTLTDPLALPVVCLHQVPSANL